jgi:hypothetical protein
MVKVLVTPTLRRRRRGHHTDRNVSCTHASTAPGNSQPVATVAAKQKKPKRTDLKTSEDLWATINVCDSPRFANTVGIRGSMPGLGHKPSRLQMRFLVQYKSRTDGKWRFADDNADSGWHTVARTIRQVVESGQNFTFMPPTDGGSHQLRGVVRFRWVREGRTVAYQRRFTEAGHKTTAGSDPKGYSAATCAISPP